MATQTFLSAEMQTLQPPGSVQTQQQVASNVVTSSVNSIVSVSVTGNSQTQQQQQTSGTQQPSQVQSRNQQASNSASPVVTSSQTSPNPQQQQQATQQQQQQQQTAVVVSQQQQQVVANPQHSPPPHQQSQQSSIVQQQQTSAQSQQFITVPVSDNDSPGGGGEGQDAVSLQSANQTVHSTYVQYVESSTDPNIYAASNGQMSAYPVYRVSDTATMYTPATEYYNTGDTTAVTYSQVSPGIGHSGNVGIQNQILTHPGTSTYLVQGGTMDGETHTLHNAGGRASPQAVSMQQEGGVTYLVQSATMDAENPHLTPTNRVSPATFPEGSEGQQFGIEVQWLVDNYETAEGVSLPRSTLYSHYLRHCAEHKLEPVNAASFGKLIRSVFLGLRTRRLGTRGNSKYHYYGIRVKPTSPLNQISEDASAMALRQQPANQGKRFKPSTTTKIDSSHSDGTHSQGTQSHISSSSSSDSTSPQQQRHQQYLGDATNVVPHLSGFDLDELSLSDGLTVEDFNIFRSMYRDHCDAFLDAVISLQFSVVETVWQQFWRNNPEDTDLEKLLSASKLFLLYRCESIQKFVQRADYEFYQNLVEVLIPDVLRPIPSSLTQAIRNFAKSLDGWLVTAMVDIPDDMVKAKLSAVSAFAQTLRRYTSLNHLAQAARAVLQNAAQINQMLADLNRVDFHNVQEQASWVCQCDDGLVSKLEMDFKMTLQQQNSLEQWAAWLEGVVNQVLLPYEGKADFAKAARQFLLKWSFYSSMVIRDLTLRSAASFGSFHLIRLLYDEYMFYVIEHRVAQATGETPIAVMGEFIGYGNKVNLRDINNKAMVITASKVDIPMVTNGNHATNHVTVDSSSQLVTVLDHHQHQHHQQQQHQQQQQDDEEDEQSVQLSTNASSKIVTGHISGSTIIATQGDVIHITKRLKA